MPAVVCGLLKECSEISLEALVQAARTASHGSLGARWRTTEERPSQTPVGASLQAANKDLLRVNFEVPEGLIAGLGYAITRPGHAFHFHQATSAADRSGVAGVHQWSVMLPTSARVAQEVCEPLIGIQYPMLCGFKNGLWHIGRTSAQSLQSSFQQSRRRANAETAVKVAGATAGHCIVLHRSNFLSGNSRCTDFDHECYACANVAH